MTWKKIAVTPEALAFVFSVIAKGKEETPA